LNNKCGICKQFVKNKLNKNILEDKKQRCSEWNVRLAVAIPTRMFAKHLTSLILAPLLSFLSSKEGRVEAVGESDFPR